MATPEELRVSLRLLLTLWASIRLPLRLLEQAVVTMFRVQAAALPISARPVGELPRKSAHTVRSPTKLGGPTVRYAVCRWTGRWEVVV